jgi:putative hydrolase of the HAD superfamily
MIDAVLFDLGDTIINFGVTRREAELLFRQGARLTYDYLAAKTAAIPTYEHYFKIHYRYMSRAYIWSKLTRRDFSYADVVLKAFDNLRLILEPGDLEHLCQLWYKPINDASNTHAGVKNMLQQLHNAGTKLAIVSNTLVPAHCLDAHLEQLGLLQFFPVRVYSSAVRYRKPHPRIFELALTQIGVPASRALFIGDLLLADIAGAKRAGMRTVWKPATHTSKHPRLRRRPTPDYTIPCVTQLPTALHHFGWRPGQPTPITDHLAQRA